MSTFQLLPEQRLLGHKQDLRLTSHRLHLEQNQWGAKKLTTIMLEDLTSCDIETRSKPAWLVGGALIGVILVMLGIASKDPGKATAAGLSAVLCLVAYLMTRRKVMVLRSASAWIELDVSRENWEELKTFVHEVQTAKHERLMSLAQSRR